MAAEVRGAFIEPMLLLRTAALPDDAGQWAYQIKLDGHRAGASTRAVACSCSPATATTSARVTRRCCRTLRSEALKTEAQIVLATLRVAADDLHSEPSDDAVTAVQERLEVIAARLSRLGQAT
jgi:hypothetical protein